MSWLEIVQCKTVTSLGCVEVVLRGLLSISDGLIVLYPVLHLQRTAQLRLGHLGSLLVVSIDNKMVGRSLGERLHFRLGL